MSLCEGTAELQLHWKTTGLFLKSYQAQGRNLAMQKLSSQCGLTAEFNLYCCLLGIKKTYDLAVVQVRKGFSHVLQHVNTCMSGKSMYNNYNTIEIIIHLSRYL